MSQLDSVDDEPLGGDDRAADYLGRGEFADAATAILRNQARSEASSVVALVGPWGGGKTSVLNMVKSRLRDETGEASGWLVADFNPWLFQDLQSLQLAFFRELSAALPNSGRGGKARERLAAFGTAVAPLGAMASLFGAPDLTASVQALSKLFALEKSPVKAHEEVEEALRDLGRPVLVVLDDLDRLAPDELLLTLKLIRLIGRLPHVHYLVAYDENTLLDTLSRTGLVGTEPRRGVDYLEKIIQVRLDLPPARRVQLDRWMDRALNDLQTRHRFEFDGDQVRRLERVLHGHLRSRLATPRAVKRYFGQVDAFLGSVSDEMDVVDFLILTWLRTAEPLVYEMLARERAALLGETVEYASFELLFGASKRKPDRRAFWEERLTRARVAKSDLDGIAELVGQLFPRFDAEWNGQEYDGHGVDPAPRRVQIAEYFDRYFAFGVPPEDIADSVARAALAQLTAGDDGEDLVAIEARVRQTPEDLTLVLGKMVNAYQLARTGGRPFLLWIARQRHALPDGGGNFLSPETAARLRAGEVYQLLPDGEQVEAIKELAREDGGLELAAYLVGAAARQSSSQPPERLQQYEAAQAAYADIVHTHLDEYTDADVWDVPTHLWGALHDWQVIDLCGAAAWLRARIALGGWPLLDVIARFVSRLREGEGSGAVYVLDSLNLTLVDRLFGLDAVMTDLSDELAVAPGPVPRDQPDTRENRRAVVLSALMEHRRARGENDAA